MRIVIEVTVPDKTVEEMQEFVFVEDAFETGDADDAITPASVTAVEAFVTMYLRGTIDFEVTKSEMHATNCVHKEFARGYCAEMSCKNYYVIG